MRIIFILSLFFMSLTQNIKAQNLEDFQWENRILLLVDTGQDTEALQSQLDELTTDKQALKERDLVIFRVTPDAVYFVDGSLSKLKARQMYDKFALDSAFKGTLLLGKDGGLKLKQPFKVSAQRIFDLIDSMPMRRAEMGTSGKN